MKDHAFQIENITARELSRHIEDKFANYAASKEKDDNDLSILVGGAGFTGVEFLGELTDRILNYVANMVWIKIKLKSLVLKQHLKCYQCSQKN